VQGKVFNRCRPGFGRNLPAQRKKNPACAPGGIQNPGWGAHLDQNYTVFGEVMLGTAVIDSLAEVPTTGRPGGRPPPAGSAHPKGEPGEAKEIR